MSIRYLQLPVDKYGSIKMEIEPTNDTSGFEDLGLKEDIEKITQTVTAEASYAFDKMLDTIRAVAYGFCERLDKLDEKMRPAEAVVEFGLALKADAGVVVAKAGGEASFKISLTWKTKEHPQEKN